MKKSVVKSKGNPKPQNLMTVPKGERDSDHLLENCEPVHTRQNSRKVARAGSGSSRYGEDQEPHRVDLDKYEIILTEEDKTRLEEAHRVDFSLTEEDKKRLEAVLLMHNLYAYNLI